METGHKASTVCEEGKGTGKRLEKVENKWMDLVRRVLRGGSAMKLVFAGRVGAQGRGCN